MPDCGVHYLWFAFVCFLIRSPPPPPHGIAPRAPPPPFSRTRRLQTPPHSTPQPLHNRVNLQPTPPKTKRLRDDVRSSQEKQAKQPQLGAPASALFSPPRPILGAAGAELVAPVPPEGPLQTPQPPSEPAFGFRRERKAPTPLSLSVVSPVPRGPHDPSPAKAGLAARSPVVPPPPPTVQELRLSALSPSRGHGLQFPDINKMGSVTTSQEMWHTPIRPEDVMTGHDAREDMMTFLKLEVSPAVPATCPRPPSAPPPPTGRARDVSVPRCPPPTGRARDVSVPRCPPPPQAVHATCLRPPAHAPTQAVHATCRRPAAPPPPPAGRARDVPAPHGWGGGGERAKMLLRSQKTRATLGH